MSKTDRPNISTEHAPEGSARRPRDTLDRQPPADAGKGMSRIKSYSHRLHQEGTTMRSFKNE